MMFILQKWCLYSLVVFLSVCSFLNGQWEPDVRLTYNDSISFTSETNAWCVAASGDTVHVIWQDGRDAGYSEIYYKRSIDDGTSWESDFRLTDDPAISRLPAIAVSGSNIHVVWYDFRDGNPEIYYKRSTDGGTTWELDTRLTNTSANSFRPSVAVSGSNVHLVWEEGFSGGYDIYHKRSTDGGITWEPSNLLSNDPANSLSPSIAISDSVVHVVWMDNRNGTNNYEIYYKRSTNEGVTWGPETRLTSDPAWSGPTSIAVSGLNIHVAWSESRDGNAEVYYKHSTDGGTNWGSDTRLTNAPYTAFGPSVAVSDLNVHIAWWDARDTGNQEEIYYKYSSDNGTTWEPDTRLTNDPSFSEYSSVAVSDSVVHVVWMDRRDGNWEIYYKRNPTGNAGVKESSEIRGKKLETKLWLTPNPFVTFTTALGHETEKFILYDITGKQIGTYIGNCIGSDISSGIYFLKELGKDAYPVSIVKVR